MIKKCCSCLSGLCCGGRWTGSSERWPQLAPPCLSPSARAPPGLAAPSPYAQLPGYSLTTAEMKGSYILYEASDSDIFFAALISLSQVNLYLVR